MCLEQLSCLAYAPFALHTLHCHARLPRAHFTLCCCPPRPCHRSTLQCDGCPVRAQGTLPPELAQLSAATTLNLQGNAFGGGLPQEWGNSSVLQDLQNL